jgi:protoporphyrinogen oxidase
VVAPQVGILGGGISGVALAAHLERPWEILEKDPQVGGLCATVQEGGFTFDAAGPHIMFSKNKPVLARMVEVLGDNVHQRRRENRIWLGGRLVKYPFENGLSDLTKEDCFECLIGYLQNPWTKPPTNLEEWAYATFGKGISEKYFLPYNRKIWNVPPAEITLDWVARIPKPPLEDVVKSAVGIPTEGALHQLHFSYPKRGGYVSLVRAFAAVAAAATGAKGGDIRTSCPVTRVSRSGDRWVVEAGGVQRAYDKLVSTLPIHELSRVWDGFPDAAREALGRLRYSSLLNVLIGLEEDRGYPYTALYIPDPAIPFHRLSFPKAFSEHSAPAGGSAMMAEITCDEGDALWGLDDATLAQQTVDHLERMGLVSPGAATYRRVMRFRYGYPIYDHAHAEQTRRLKDAVAAAGVHLLGRFAEFDYINSDVCVERAMRLAGSLR